MSCRSPSPGVFVDRDSPFCDTRYDGVGEGAGVGGDAASKSAVGVTALSRPR
jgi:hypothetical protein